MVFKLLKYIIILTLFTFVIFKFMNMSSKVTAEEVEKPSGSNLNDGPHLFWESETDYRVVYSDDGKLVETYGSTSDSNHFWGAGYDEGHQYRIGFEPPQDYQYDSVAKFFAFSDTHGEFDYTVELLQAQDIIDQNNNWSFGEGHLVVVGDLTDRGRKVTELLWLIYKLEDQARKSGGMVHYILGNHEIMVLQKDLRYINPDYAKICSLLAIDYDQMYSTESELGRWLRTKNTMMKLNDVLFVHGGIKADVIDWQFDITEINNLVRASIDTPRDSIKQNDTLSYIYRSFGPFWYRGFHYEMEKYPMAGRDEIKSVLKYFEASNVVVGHTVVDSVSPLFEGLIYAVNQDYELKAEYEGLFWEAGHFYAGDINGERRLID